MAPFEITLKCDMGCYSCKYVSAKLMVDVTYPEIMSTKTVSVVIYCVGVTDCVCPL